MMKNTVLFLVLISITSCSQKEVQQDILVEESSAVAPYDTIAIDSFSQGATSVDIARKIRMSSLQYQDSIRAVKIKEKDEVQLKKAVAEKLDLEKKAEEQKKKAALEAKKVLEKAEEKTN